MLRAIDLHQLPQISPALAHLVGDWRLGSLGFSHPFFNHDPALAFPGELEFVHFPQLLVRQRRPKIFVLFLDQIQGLLGNACVQPVVARFAPPSTNQSFGTLLAVGSP